jgi:hypothetical protein
MGASRAYPDSDKVSMSSNIFGTQLVPPSVSNERKCPCYMYKNTRCSLCSPKTGIQPSGSTIPSSSSWPTQSIHHSESDVDPNQRQTSASAVVAKTAPVQDGVQAKSHSPLRIRIPRRGRVTRAADSQAVQVLPSSSVQIKVEDSAPAPLSFIPPPPAVSPPPLPPLIRISDEVENSIDQRIPSNLPPEVQIIIDAYISGTPLNVIASKSMLKAHWGVSVPEECAYVYMGFFVVAEVFVRFSFPFHE